MRTGCSAAPPPRLAPPRLLGLPRCGIVWVAAVACCAVLWATHWVNAAVASAPPR